ncbi:MAG: tyrosine-type recombinase/integrase [Flavobacteriales bacterium]
MEDAILYTPPKNAKRIKVYIPYIEKQWRMSFKAINSSFWHPNQKLWSVINTPENVQLIKSIFGKRIKISTEKASKPITEITIDTKGAEALEALEKTLILKRYSSNTIQNYTAMFKIFLSRFKDRALDQITKEEIESFIFLLIKKNNISESFQNSLINAIKAYYEHVLRLPRAVYTIERPKKAINLPNVLNVEDVNAILQTPSNIKHKAILCTIYSAGLRISEVVNLRIEDINSASGYIFVKASKGKKDRKTVLSASLLPLLRTYYQNYKPSYWLFEGATGGKYSVASVRKVFRKAVKEAKVNPWATVHTLRHSFATHCIQNNVNMRHVQNMLGHANPKTTELYTKTIEINNKKIKSPLDSLKDFNTFMENKHI